MSDTKQCEFCDGRFVITDRRTVFAHDSRQCPGATFDLALTGNTYTLIPQAKEPTP